MAAIKSNIIANYLGQGWRALIGVAFIPLYIKYLGIEAYGLIGIFAILQAWLTLLDMGMRTALSREMARFTGGANDIQFIRDLLRSVEILGVVIAGVVGIGIWAASGWLASEWVKIEHLPLEVVASAFAAMGSVTALRFIESIYVSSIAGLQRQVLENILSSTMVTVRGLGAIAMLAWVSPTIEAFFMWQGLVSLGTVVLFACVVYRTLPSPPRPTRFSGTALMGIRRFAAGMTAITFLALLLTQVDKILLSRLLPLESFAYYALAATLSGALYMMASPVCTAFYPRFTELVIRGDQRALSTAYHQGAQLVTVSMGTAAIMLIVFSNRVLLLWTGDASLTENVAPLLLVLSLGTLLNGLMWIPFQMQLAHGWTNLGVKINIVAIVVLIPTILWVVPKYGAIGAAWVWVTLNIGYLVLVIYFMHRRLMQTEKWRWYRQDIAIPLAAAAGAATLCRWLTPTEMGKLGEFTAVLISSILVLLAAVFAAPMVRHQLAEHVPGRIKALCVKHGYL